MPPLPQRNWRCYLSVEAACTLLDGTAGTSYLLLQVIPVALLSPLLGNVFPQHLRGRSVGSIGGGKKLRALAPVPK